MIRRPGRHPADPAARAVLNRRLWKLRQDAGLTRVEMGERLGISAAAFGRCEESESWKVSRVQGWCRALDHRLEMSLVGLQVPDCYDLRADVLATAVTFGAVDEDRIHLLAVVNDLIRVREHLGLGHAEMAYRMGVTDRAVSCWESMPDPTLLKIVQRYARGLGGSLGLDVVPVRVAVAS